MTVDVENFIENPFFIYPDDVVKKAETTSSGFPKILWRTYKDYDLPKHWEEGFQSGKILKGWTMIFMTDNDNDLFVKRLFPELWDLYNTFEYKIQKIDLVRILYLYQFGGLYSDLDKIFLKDFSHYFESKADVYLVRSPNHKASYTNSFMGSMPRVKLWSELIQAIKEKNLPFYAWGRHLKVMNTTGPSILTRVVENSDSSILKLPSRYFESCSVCDYPCKTEKEEGMLIKNIKGSSWAGIDTKIYLCFLCSWPQIVFAIIFILVLFIFTFLI